MNGAKGQRLVFPGLAGFYATWGEIAYALMRVVIGYILFMHGWQKFKTGITGVAGFMSKSGLMPGELFAGAAIFLETVGALCIIVGLFTRFFAAALAIEMLIALLLVHLPKGYAASGGGYEYVLLIGAVCFLIAIRGGGPYSVDRMIGREL